MNEFELEDYDPTDHSLDENDIEYSWAFGIFAVMILVGLVTSFLV